MAGIIIQISLPAARDLIPTMPVTSKSLARNAILSGNSILPTEWYRDLATRYGEATRAYHTLEHISSLLELLEQHAAAANDRESMVWAIWFHECIPTFHPQQV